MKEIESRLVALEKNLIDIKYDIQVLRAISFKDTNLGLNKIRYITEKVLYELCTKNKISWGDHEPTLENMIGPLIKNTIVPKHISTHVRSIQSYSSPGSHFQADALTATHVNIAQMALVEFLEWYFTRLQDEAIVPGKPIAAREETHDDSSNNKPIEESEREKSRPGINKWIEFLPWRFLLVGFLEITILISIILSGIFPSMTLYFKGSAGETGIGFLEGILKSTSSRIFLLFCVAFVSIILTILANHLLKKRINAIKLQLFKLSIPLIMFNIFLVLMLFLSFEILKYFDLVSNLL